MAKTYEMCIHSAADNGDDDDDGSGDGDYGYGGGSSNGTNDDDDDDDVQWETTKKYIVWKLYRHYLHNSGKRVGADTFTIVHIMHIVRVSS